jgi:arylsulfatase A
MSIGVILMKHLLLAVLAVGVLAGGAQAQEKKRQPNIIHIIGDDVGYDDIGCYGGKHTPTPNVDRLATSGMRFTSFYAPHPYCTPSRAAILTGCYAQRVGIPRVLFPNDTIGLNPNEITIAELLRKIGYRTALIGKWHLGHLVEHQPTRHGFDLYFGIPYPNDHVPERLTATEPKKSRGFPPIPLIRNEKVVEQPAQLATLPERFAAEAVKFIEDNKDRPFFLHYANIETHIPWLVTRPFMNKSKAGLFGDALYCLDWQVGQILDALKKHGLEKDTLIVFTTDNGRLRNVSAELEGIYGHAAAVDAELPSILRGGKGQSRYEGGVRVPGIFVWPARIPARSVCVGAATGFDLYTTFAKVAGAEIPKDRIIDGKDLTPLLFATQGAKSPHSSLYFYEGFNLVAVRQENWKLVLPGPGAKKKKAPTQIELYDLEADLSQTKNIAAAHSQMVEELLRVVEQAREDIGDDATKRKGRNRRPPGDAK